MILPYQKNVKSCDYHIMHCWSLVKQKIPVGYSAGLGRPYLLHRESESKNMLVYYRDKPHELHNRDIEEGGVVGSLPLLHNTDFVPIHRTKIYLLDQH